MILKTAPGQISRGFFVPWSHGHPRVVRCERGVKGNGAPDIFWPSSSKKSPSQLLTASLMFPICN